MVAKAKRRAGVVGWCHHCGTVQWEHEARRFRGTEKCVTWTCDEDWDFGIWAIHGGKKAWSDQDWGSCMLVHATNHAVIWEPCGDSCQVPESGAGPRRQDPG